MDSDPTEPTTASYHRALEQRVATWLKSDEAQEMECAGLYRHLPELYGFLLGLACDHRIPQRARVGVVSALKYIIQPYDLVPEGILGTAGFRDDLVLAALVIDHLFEVADEDVLSQHWHHSGKAREIARGILDASGRLVEADVYSRLHAWVPN